MRALFVPVLVLTACGSRLDGERHALVIGWDGVRPDAAQEADTPHLDALTVDWAASTQLTGPTKSAPGWMSTLTGVEPDKHGVTANGDYSARNPQWTTVLERAHAAGATPVHAAVHWPEILGSIVEEGATDAATLGTDAEVTAWVVDDLTDADPRLVLTHHDNPDANGHGTGFSADNPLYIAAIEVNDAQLGEMLAAVRARPAFDDEDWLVLVTTDHGGEGTDHGPQDSANQTIFFAMDVLDRDVELTLDGTSHMDVAPTVLDWLGLDVPDGLDGTSRVP